MLKNSPIGKRIKDIRKHFGLTQVAFGGKLGVEGSYISMIETGKGRPSPLLIKAVCREFSVEEAWLGTGQGPKFRGGPPAELAGREAAWARGVEDVAYRIGEAGKKMEATLAEEECELIKDFRCLEAGDRAFLRQLARQMGRKKG